MGNNTMEYGTAVLDAVGEGTRVLARYAMEEAHEGAARRGADRLGSKRCSSVTRTGTTASGLPHDVEGVLPTSNGATPRRFRCVPREAGAVMREIPCRVCGDIALRRKLVRCAHLAAQSASDRCFGRRRYPPHTRHGISRMNCSSFPGRIGIPSRRAQFDVGSTPSYVCGRRAGGCTGSC